MEKELEKIQDNSPAEMIRMAVSGNANLDQIQKLLALQERWEANEARKAFASAFAVAQSSILTVFKTKSNRQTNSKYADLGDIIESAKPMYTKEGFSVIFYEGETKAVDNIRICADVLHTKGHKETYYYDVPMDGVGMKGNPNMTKIHGKASSTSYGRRYLMCMIWNIPTHDDDAQQDTAKIDEGKIKILTDLIKEKGADEKKFLAYMKVEKIEDISIDMFAKAKIALESRKPKGKTNENS